MSARTVLSARGRPPRADAGRLVEPAGVEGWPPPPHDPRERELALVVAGWEVRLFGGRKFEYFVARGFWHLQLWHPEARVSVLTPSRLTRGLYEAYPIANWKAQAPDYDKLAALLDGLSTARLPEASAVLRLERALVDEVVRGGGGVAS
ncbi:hypothetical protein [Sorangium sp. So ce176]|uniref:hypothetical protein n=1 Tax=Sorangium sp. So ce176 TaxID=3133286 RepID=UPI003F641AA8